MRALLAAVVALAILATAGPARAGGFYLTDRGARPLGRGGAFVAGADDPSALWYNPAGLAFSGRQLMIDASWNALSASFTRVDGGGVTQPSVSASVAPIPVPGVAYSDSFGLRDWTFGLGIFAPNALLLSWPSTIDVMGTEQPAPQRYSLITMNGSLLAHLILGAAWKPIPQLSVGLAGELLFVTFRARTTLSACDRAICTQPENPEYDALAEVNLENAVVPTASLGVTWDPGPVRVAFSARLPYTIGGDANIRVRVPSAPAFDGATVSGDRAHLSLDFPWSLRVGVELRSVENLRVEAALVWETWSTQRSLVIDPDHVRLENVLAVGNYDVGRLLIPRHMIDTLSIRVGGEYHFADTPVDVRMGLSYENGSFPDKYLTPLTLDSDKFISSFGASAELTRGVYVDAVVAYVWMRSREVTNSGVPQANPIRPPPVSDTVYVGNGRYSMDDWVIGIGLRWQLDARPRAPASPSPAVSPPHSPSSSPPPDSLPASPPHAPGARPGGWPPRAITPPPAAVAPPPPPAIVGPPPPPIVVPPPPARPTRDVAPTNPYRTAPLPPVVDDDRPTNPYRPAPRHRRPHTP